MASFCSHELQILIKICTTARNFLKVPLRINSFYCSNFNDFFDFNVPFQVTIGGTKTFIGKREYVLGGKNRHSGKN